VKELDQATSYSIYTQDSKNVLHTDNSLKKTTKEPSTCDKVKLTSSVKELVSSAESAKLPPPTTRNLAITDTPLTSAVDEVSTNQCSLK